MSITPVGVNIEAADMVRSPKLWRDLSEVLLLQSNHMAHIAQAIETNNHDLMVKSISDLVSLVESRRSTMELLAPAMNDLMAEVLS